LFGVTDIIWAGPDVGPIGESGLGKRMRQIYNRTGEKIERPGGRNRAQGDDKKGRIVCLEMVTWRIDAT